MNILYVIKLYKYYKPILLILPAIFSRAARYIHRGNRVDILEDAIIW